jgi:hypothetical protein
MKRTTLTLVTGALAAILPLGASAQAAPDHTVAAAAGETKTWRGTAKLGLNSAFLTDVPDRRCEDAPVGDFYYDPRTACDTILVSATNPVPDTDADGKLRRNITITLNEFLGGAQAPTDVDFMVRHSDATGAKGAPVEGGNGVGWSANGLPDDPDESVTFPVETTRTSPTQYYLVEVFYFISVYATDLCALPEQVRPTPCAPYKGTVQF